MPIKTYAVMAADRYFYSWAATWEHVLRELLEMETVISSGGPNPSQLHGSTLAPQTISTFCGALKQGEFVLKRHSHGDIGYVSLHRDGAFSKKKALSTVNWLVAKPTMDHM